MDSTSAKHILAVISRKALLDSFGTSSFLAPALTSTTIPSTVIQTDRYHELLAQEARHWGGVRPDAENPQIWHDPQLFEIFFGREYRELLDRAARAGPDVLELGCGEGDFAIRLAQRGLNVTAIDLSPERIERARAKAKELKLGERLEFSVNDLNTIALPEGRYDSVVAHDALHHILQIDRLCAEVHKTLKQNGSFVVMDFIGLGPVRKFLAAVLYGILPTYKSYRSKWNLRHRLPAFLASESRRRKSIEEGSAMMLPQDSPFEEIAQRSVVKEIRRRFVVTRYSSYCPFFYYFAAKVRMPLRIKYRAARMLRSMDDLIAALHLAPGAYFSLEARKQ